MLSLMLTWGSDLRDFKSVDNLFEHTDTGTKVFINYSSCADSSLFTSLLLIDCESLIVLGSSSSFGFCEL